MSQLDQSFETYEQWVNCASRWLTDHPRYMETREPANQTRVVPGMLPFRAVCFDALGRLCRSGADFMRARDEDAFPVRWVWPDQVGTRLIELERRVDKLDAEIEELIGPEEELRLPLETRDAYEG